MTTKTEGKHFKEFLLSQAPGTLSFETATVANGQNLVAGQVVQLSGANLVACDGLLDTAGDLITDVEGIICDNVDASDGAVAGCTYLARLAEVTDTELTYPTESTAGGEKAATIASLKKLNIRPR